MIHQTQRSSTALKIKGENIMCGISLIISKNNYAVSEEQIRAMNDAVAHRGPDGEGFHFGSNFAMGHRRLSIVDLSDAGLQPMKRRDDYIIFNGMIYNYLELKKELVQAGYTFYTQTDTEVLLVACQHWGLDVFRKLNGMWAFSWYRANKNQIVLCRDYFGIKPLYYTSNKDFFAASSEIKQFLALPGFTPSLNKNIAVNFLVNGFLNYSENTFFKGVKELRGGHYMVYNLDDHRHKIVKWYDLPASSKAEQKTWSECAKEMKNLFGDSLKKRMRADVNIGSCLSGGIDSSTMVSYLHAHKLANHNFATVTSCYTNPRYDERIFSDEVSRVTGYRGFKVFPQLNNLFEAGEFDKILYHQEQPFGTGSHYSEFQVFKTASEQKLTVMLDGQGADEYFGGYDEFFIIHLHGLILSGRFADAFRNIRGKAKNSSSSILSVIRGYAKTVYWYPLVKWMKKLLGWSNYEWLNASWKKIADQHLVTFKANNLRDLSLQEVMFSSLPLQLHSEDRNSMMCSIESRLPYLDHRLVEYVIGLPCNYKIRNGISKYILREAIEEVPALIKKRTDKMGFVAPDEPWILENHHQFRLELQDAVSNSDIFSAELLKRFDRFIAGKLNYEPIYFRAIALHRFMKVFKMQGQQASLADNLSIPEKILVKKNLVPAIVSCSNLLSDVNYC